MRLNALSIEKTKLCNISQNFNCLLSSNKQLCVKFFSLFFFSLFFSFLFFFSSSSLSFFAVRETKSKTGIQFVCLLFKVDSSAERKESEKRQTDKL